MSLFVTGASGYLGSELVRGSHPRVELRDASAVRATFESLRPAAVINTAYRPDDRSVTYDGAVAVSRAAAAVGARLIQISTDLVFDGEKGTPYVEEDEPTPLSDYGAAKAEAERAVLAGHPRALVVRTSLLYGKPGPQERLATDPGATFFTDEIRCPIHVGDLAAALLELVELELTGVLHVAGPDAISRAEFAELLAASPVRTGTIAESGQRRARDCSLAIDRARRLLRTPLRGAREVLERRRARP